MWDEKKFKDMTEGLPEGMRESVRNIAERLHTQGIEFQQAIKQAMDQSGDKDKGGQQAA